MPLVEWCILSKDGYLACYDGRKDEDQRSYMRLLDQAPNYVCTNMPDFKTVTGACEARGQDP